MPKFIPDPVEDLEQGQEPEGILSKIEIQARGQAELNAAQAKFDAATPQWIKDWCDLPEHNGGWFFPMSLSATHPLVAEGWKCYRRDCGETFTAEDTALIMPFFSEAQWLTEHSECSAMGIFGDRSAKTRAEFRPKNYSTLSPERQWIIDKRLNLLDWDGE